jgi:DeoR/GlpR family transcriptional regulator of sugar metabolism
VRTGERRLAIETLLHSQGEVDFDSLAKRFEVSVMTVRRDLEALQLTGTARLVRKGAILVSRRGFEPPVQSRDRARAAEKALIAQEAAQLVASGQSIYLDAGTTMVALARALAACTSELFVVTANLRVTPILALNPGIRTVVPAGLVRPQEQSVVGSDAERFVSSFNVDLAFLGAAGVDPVKGVTDFGVDETRVKQSAMRSAQRRVLLADTTKLFSVALCHVCDLDDIEVLITDAPADHPAATALAAKGVEWLTASGPAPGKEEARD